METTDDNVAYAARTKNTAQHSSSSPAKPNAFTELMKPKPKAQPKMQEDTDRRFINKSDQASRDTRRFGRDGLAEYTRIPENFPATRVIYYNDKFVVINDMFPKSSVHLLLLPRDKEKSCQRGQQAFDDPQFLADCKAECDKAKLIVAEELRRRYGKYSRTELARIEAMDADDPPNELPDGRNWLRWVKSGIHARPSMNHLHIHVMSKDMVSEPLKHAHHYHSFQDSHFFIGLEQFPLNKDDSRRVEDTTNFAEGRLACWRCEMEFGTQFKKLKAHLEEELDAWKRE